MSEQERPANGPGEGNAPDGTSGPSRHPVTGPAGTHGSVAEPPGPGEPSTAAPSGPEPVPAHAPVGLPGEGAGALSATPVDATSPKFGVPGMPVNRAHPFYVGFMGGIGVLLAYGLLQSVTQLSSVLTLLLVALFLALGLDPLVALLQRRGMGRGMSVTVVVLGVIAAFAGFVAAVVPTIVTQATDFGTQLPDLVNQLQSNPTMQRLDERFGIVANATNELEKWVTNKDTVLTVFGGVFGAGKVVVSGVFSTFTVLVLTLYILASKQTMTEAAYRLVPASRRERVRLLGDEILRRIGSYIAGQVTVAAINGVLTYVLLLILDIDYALVLAIAVAILGLIPMIGATLGAVVIVVVALFHSWQAALIALVYYLVYQQVENYLISPRIMSRAVSVPGSVAMIAALAGGTLLGILGALVAIPVAAGILLIIEEVVLPRQAQH